ncbi:hypothetical protein EV191_110186 [Tamaricihabitans halophyticus]|uniref:THUMP-like domain-containing protein n=1 Tax=Tamaricihabitans halophyticus TaxID=1262583 RepID=A0A4V2ST65_9PSEU|nr:class I SAM-dependent methyltransferase [Tamaricihabitans halophyticus]TCP48626.1 hypothetical protein EV191_110186 [Tamaricihabitans halophyticus]
MGYRFGRADVEFLTSATGREALRTCAELPLTSASRMADVAAARGVAGSDFAGAVLETVLLRRKSVEKLPGFSDWLFTDEALQQATAWPVALHRAERIAGLPVHDVTCSVGVDLAALGTRASTVLGSDVDEVRLAMARHNLGLAGSVPWLTRADALRPVSRAAVVFADPGRRDKAGRRSWRPSDYAPPLGELAEVYGNRELVVKCAPGIDRSAVPWAREFEVVSLDGRVREACLWAGALAGPRSTATVLGSDGSAWSVTEDEPDDCVEREPGAWLVDPDGAIVRAGLVRQYAARHGLGQLDERIAYLTGDHPPPGVRAFRVLEHGKFREKSLRQALRARGVGKLEILARGVDIDPDELRNRLKPKGEAAVSVLLTRIGRAPHAFICEPHRT